MPTPPADVLGRHDSGRVRILTLNRPDKLNAIDQALASALLAALAEADRDETAGAIVLAGAGPSFCAGADVSEHATLSTPKLIRAHAARTRRLQAAFASLSKPVIAAVQGHALGAGCGLAMACDLVICSMGARLGYPEVKRNVVPALVLPNLIRQVGRKAAFELLATGMAISADRALALGMVNRVVPEGRLLTEATALAAELGDRNPRTLHWLKRLFAESGEMPLPRALDLAQTVNARSRLERLAAGAATTTRSRRRRPAKSHL